MARLCISITAKQIATLKKMSMETGLTVSDVVRRLLDKALKGEKR